MNDRPIVLVIDDEIQIRVVEASAVDSPLKP